MKREGGDRSGIQSTRMLINIINQGVLCNRSTSSIGTGIGIGIGIGNGGGGVVVKRSSACRASLRVGLAGTSASAAGIVVAVAVSSIGTGHCCRDRVHRDTIQCSADTFWDDCKKPLRIQRPKSRKAESCTTKCLTTCIRGGQGSPGEGPFNVRRPLVVFKEGFRSRRYCLVECSDICNLIGNGEDGP